MRLRPQLTVHAGKLLSGKGWGEPVYAGADIRRRLITLDSSLLDDPRDFTRILIHEVFHFAWARLGNPARRAFVDLVEREFSSGARGELGWSSQYRKDILRTLRCSRSARLAVDFPHRWRGYVCESFCDSAAWVYSGLHRHDEFTLAARYRQRRAAWFSQLSQKRKVLI